MSMQEMCNLSISHPHMDSVRWKKKQMPLKPFGKYHKIPPTFNKIKSWTNRLPLISVKIMDSYRQSKGMGKDVVQSINRKTIGVDIALSQLLKWVVSTLFMMWRKIPELTSISPFNIAQDSWSHSVDSAFDESQTLGLKSQVVLG